MLRLPQSTARISRGVIVASRNDTLLPSSRQQQHGMSMLRALPSPAKTSSSGRGSTSCGGKESYRATKRSNACAGRREPAFSSVAYRPSMLSTGGSSKRLMSTSTGANNPDASETGSNAAATASTNAGSDAMAGAPDAAMAAAGAADQVGRDQACASDDSRGNIAYRVVPLLTVDPPVRP